MLNKRQLGKFFAVVQNGAVHLEYFERLREIKLKCLLKMNDKVIVEVLRFY